MNPRIVFVMLPLACSVFANSTLAPLATPSETNARMADVTIALRQLDESRRTKLVEEDEFGFDFNRPGLLLTYDLAIAEELTVYAVEQPKSVEARDSTGADLSRIEEGFRGEREYVELKQNWDEPPTGFTFRLLPSTRGALTFDLNTTFHLIVFEGIEQLDVQPQRNWEDIDATHFASEKVQAKLAVSGFGGETAQFSLRPGSVRDVIETVYLVDGDEEVKSMSVMWSSDSAHYGFDHPYREGQRIRVTIRTDVYSLPITLNLSEHSLP